MTVPTIKPADMGAITESNAPLLLDVRTPSEFAAIVPSGDPNIAPRHSRQDHANTMLR